MAERLSKAGLGCAGLLWAELEGRAGVSWAGLSVAVCAEILYDACTGIENTVPGLM